jgi:hypothetical protein
MQFLAVLAKKLGVHIRKYQKVSVYNNITPLIWLT